MSAPRLAEKAVSWFSQTMRERVPHSPDNAFLEGPFAPVPTEQTLTDLAVEGRLPEQLNGTYMRIGPNPLQVDNPATYHWFTGDGMVHGVRLQDGQAQWYRNRWIASDDVQAQRGGPRTPGPRRGVSTTVNTNVYGHAGGIWATTEAGVFPVELNEDLSTRRYAYFNAQASLPYTAHPHVDPATGSLHAICYDATNPRALQYVVIDDKGALAHQASIPVSGGPMVHDCAITATRVVILDLPVTFSPKALLTGARFPYKWNPSHGARVGLIPKGGLPHEVQWWHTEPCAVFHTCNAFDQADGSAVIDVVVHERMFDESKIGPEIADIKVTFERWTLAPGQARVQRQVWSQQSQEFPRFDERLAGRPYRYAYTVGFANDLSKPMPLIRHDLQTGEVLQRSFGPRTMPGEFVFVPNTEVGRSELGGWLMGLVYDDVSQTSSLYVIDANDFNGTPTAVVHLGTRVPAGFHGNWVPSVNALR